MSGRRSLPVKEFFRYCPRCAAPAPPSETTKFFHCDSCAFRLYFNTASAVAVFLRDANGSVLFLQRAREPGKGKLGLPGGFVDAGESAEAAAYREIEEEIGRKTSGLTYLCTAPNTYPYRGVTYPTSDVYYVGNADAVGLVRQESEVTDFVWRDPFTVEYDELAFASLRDAMRVYRERFRG
jgi:NADH pyrophosphatase NudC (nudix superfamily)